MTPNLPGLLVSAAHKSSGKTTLTLGLAAALRQQGGVVQPFKKGPDYIDPAWLTLAAGRDCINLDPHLQTPAALRSSFIRAGTGADLALVEGNMGLFDGLALDGSNSNAALAKQLGLPVLLVLDCRGMAHGVAPLLLGYQQFDRDLRIAGVVLNRVGGSRHEAKLRAAIAHYTDLPVLGAVAEDAALALVERHLGLMPCAELPEAQALVHTIAQRVAQQVDLAAVQALAATAQPVVEGSDDGPHLTTKVNGSIVVKSGLPALALAQPKLRIGIARDRAFGFYYPDDLAALQAAGADLVFINTLHDQRLPPLDGLFIGGGFPETCMAALQANTALRAALRQAIVGGLPTYAECGGLMFLSRSLHYQGQATEMVGVIPGDAVMHARPVGRGYVQLQATGDAPWGPAAGASVQGHEFHHSSLENLPPGLRYAWRVQRGHGIDGAHDGLLLHRLVAAYTHQRQGAGSQWVAQFMAYVRACREADQRPAADASAAGPLMPLVPPAQLSPATAWAC